MYRVTRREVSDMEREIESGRIDCSPHRIIFCESAMPVIRIQSLAERINELNKRLQHRNTVEICGTSPSGWKGVLRNVPSQDGNKVRKENAEIAASHQIVTVSYTSSDGSTSMEVCGPILVLFNLKYRGNVGTIVRAAVQANCFKAIYFVGSGIREEAHSSAGESYHWEKNKIKGVKDADISYYSLHNAPLIDKRRFATDDDFLKFLDMTYPDWPLIGVDGGTTVYGTPLSLYSREAMELLDFRRNFFLVMGAEDHGLPERLLSRCSSLISIPCLSASINVSCAFSMVLAVMLLNSEGSTTKSKVIKVFNRSSTTTFVTAAAAAIIGLSFIVLRR